MVALVEGFLHDAGHASSGACSGDRRRGLARVPLQGGATDNTQCGFCRSLSLTPSKRCCETSEFRQRPSVHARSDSPYHVMSQCTENGT